MSFWNILKDKLGIYEHKWVNINKQISRLYKNSSDESPTENYHSSAL